jgi:hypothetical protein
LIKSTPMNLENFSKRYAVSSRHDLSRHRESAWLEQNAKDHPDFLELVEEFGGCVFEQGLYRIHVPEACETWSIEASEAFSEFGKLAIFGQDWQGNQFGIKAAGPSTVVLLQIGSGQAFEIADTLQQAHEVEFVEFADEALAIRLWQEWLASGGAIPKFDQCVGLINPLFLGGSNKVENLRLCDTEVYWDITSQLLAQARISPPGTKIANIRLAR